MRSRTEVSDSAAQRRRRRFLGRSIGPVGVEAVSIGGAVVVVAAVVAWAATLGFVRATSDPADGANIGAGSVFLVLLLVGCGVAGFLAAQRKADHPVVNGVVGAVVGYAVVSGVASLFGEPEATLAVATFVAPLAMGTAVVGGVVAARRGRRPPVV